MPRREEHDMFELMIIGRITGITEILDQYSDELKGQHQKKGHDMGTVEEFFMLTGDVDVLLAGYLHLFLDEYWKKVRPQIRRERIDEKEGNT